MQPPAPLDSRSNRPRPHDDCETAGTIAATRLAVDMARESVEQSARLRAVGAGDPQPWQAAQPQGDTPGLHTALRHYQNPDAAFWYLALSVSRPN
jgi:hypothetical protein